MGLPTCARAKGPNIKRKTASLQVRIQTSLTEAIPSARLSLTANTAHPISPQHAHARGEYRRRQRDEHTEPEFHPRLLVGSQRPRQVILRRWSVIAEFIHGENPVARVVRHHEICEWPTHSQSRGHESCTSDQCFRCVTSAGKSALDKIKDNRTRQH